MLSNKLKVHLTAAFVVLILVTLVASSAIAEAQQAKKVPRIGVLSGGSPSSNSANVDAFRQGLREFGYMERKNIIIEYRFAEGKRDRLTALAAELVRLKVDVIVASGTAEASAANSATKTIPIVMPNAADPVGSGLVASLARPGGNLTGMSILAPELSGKRLQLLKETVSESLARGRTLESRE